MEKADSVLNLAGYDDWQSCMPSLSRPVYRGTNRELVLRDFDPGGVADLVLNSDLEGTRGDLHAGGQFCTVRICRRMRAAPRARYR